jgi:HTH-like domain
VWAGSVPCWECRERRACAVLGQRRPSQRYVRPAPADEAALTAAIVALASEFGRYRYRRVSALLNRDGWLVNHKQVEPDLAAGGAEGAPATTQAGPAVAQQRIVHPSAAMLAPPRVGL